MADHKNRILELLRNEQPDFVSGEFICGQLKVSRTAIWKSMESLRKDGYEIEARPRAGYRLLSSPDTIRPAEWVSGIKSQVIGLNQKYLSKTASTNDLAKELAKQGAVEGTVVLVEEQTAGKGRLGRAWVSPPRTGLYFSIILYPGVSPIEVTQATMLAAVAVAKSLQRLLKIEARVKWPNDIYINEQKVCGILAEMVAEADRVKYLVIGIGINVNQTTEDFVDMDRKATSLRIQTGGRVNRAEVLRTVLEELDTLYSLWQQEGFIPLKGMWREMALWIGKPVVVQGLQGVWEGEMEDIDDYGALIIKYPNGNRQKFYSGEVSLRPQE